MFGTIGKSHVGFVAVIC